MRGKKRLYPYNGKKYTLNEILKITGLSKSTLCVRLHRGWSIEKAINTKPRQHNNHGMRKTRLYDIWRGIKERCCNPDKRHKKYYQDRGITICDEWLNNNKTFFDWALNNGYQDNLTIDRIDNNKGYSPDNCRWVSQSIQINNRRTSFLLEYKPDMWLTVKQIAEIEDIPYYTTYNRYVKSEKTKLPRKYVYE